jgi:hypothetical protein
MPYRVRSLVRTLRSGRATYVVGANGPRLQQAPALRAIGRPEQSEPELEQLAVGYVAIPKAVIDAEFDTHQSDDELA